MEVTVFIRGNAVRPRINRMFDTHGPWLLGEIRLDQLKSVEVVRDASTVTTTEKSSGTITNEISIGRAIVGGIVGGGVAAVVVTVRVDDFADASVITIVVGLKLAVESLEKPDAVNEIVPVKPPTGVAVTV